MERWLGSPCTASVDLLPSPRSAVSTVSPASTIVYYQTMFLADVDQPRSLLANFIIPLLPWVVLFFFVWLSGRWQSRPAMKLISEMREHIASVEAKLDRVIALMEKNQRGG